MIRSVTEYNALRRGKSPEVHGFAALRVECECGRNFTPEKFEEHLREERFQKFKQDLSRAMRGREEKHGKA